MNISRRQVCLFRIPVNFNVGRLSRESEGEKALLCFTKLVNYRSAKLETTFLDIHKEARLDSRMKACYMLRRFGRETPTDVVE